MTAGTLHIVATPIGNLSDISQRALEVLKSVDLIACEDTRHSGKLLSAYQIQTPMCAYHEHNEVAQTARLVGELQSGRQVALITDAGTPCISDPGYRLVKACREEHIKVSPIPGPAAFLAALSASGMPTHAFYFAGFPPVKQGRKKTFLTELVSLPGTLIFYESPYRIQKTLQLMHEVYGKRHCMLAREITKLHEEFVSGSIVEVMTQLGERKIKGECVILVEGQVRR